MDDKAEKGTDLQHKAYEALLRAQKKFQPIKLNKTANAGTYSYDYASLDAIFDATKPALQAEGFAVVQPITVEYHWDPEHNHEWVEIHARLSLHHRAGGTLAPPELVMRAENSRPQSVGSAMTYARRYQYTAFLGLIAEADDDGNAAQGTGAQTGDRQKGAGRTSGQRRKPQDAGNGKSGGNGDQPAGDPPKEVRDAHGIVRFRDGKLIDNYQVKNNLIIQSMFSDLSTLLKQKGIPVAKFETWLRGTHDIRAYDIPTAKYDEVMAVVGDHPEYIMKYEDASAKSSE